MVTWGTLDSQLEPQDSHLGPLESHLGPLDGHLGSQDHLETFEWSLEVSAW